MIDVRDYDPSWPARFEELRARYAAALDDAGVPCVAIEHVGSTAVPGLAAKPVIDIDVVVEPLQVGPATAALAALGFVPQGELGIPQRWAFTGPDGFADTHTYVVANGSLALRNHLAVRDTLRANGLLRDEYVAVKLRLARTAADIEEYGSGKNETIQRILAAAGLTDEERASINANVVPARRDRPPADRPAN